MFIICIIFIIDISFVMYITNIMSKAEKKGLAPSLIVLPAIDVMRIIDRYKDTGQNTVCKAS